MLSNLKQSIVCFFVVILGVTSISGCGSSTDNVEVVDNSVSTDTSGEADGSSGESSDDGSDENSEDSSDSTDDTAQSENCDASSTVQIDELICAVETFLATLSDTQLSDAQIEWDNTESLRTVWSNLPGVNRNGVQLGDLDETSLAAVKTVAALLFSEDGYEDFIGILAADDYLQSIGGGNAYSSDNYYFAVFGEPSASGQWMIQLGGHHLAYNVTFTSGTGYPVPHHIGVEPKGSFEINSSTYAPLADEGNAMVAMFEGLSATELATAYLSGESYSDVIVGPDNGNGYLPTDYPTGTDRKGVLVSDLSESKQELVFAAMKQWVADYLSDISERLMAEYTSAEALADTYIAWAGTQSKGVDVDTSGTYVRIDGPRLWIELVCQNGVIIRNQTHYHTVYRDKTMDYGNTL